ncbi:hybrid sensor histidine kinase/response regulator [Candidatus Albibeggiatoa sp. nov. NOAA]|uniref:hybrid sensor histidine kinase/response regulator n=1 Tax=Candidatus Albibeggiatoa sp. nov. NOAA TaxID=3162724 RepID=UPI003303DDF7|nr:hybrid sensor histidine kinase/response regulator [Thiotrichaceae bacterium]
MKKQIILCVDDEQSILESLKIELIQLLDNSYLIETAEDGSEALEIIEELLKDGYEIPLVISDYIMPNMKGDELLRYVYQSTPKTLSIMLTGQADTQAIGNAINRGNLYRYIAKPWESFDFTMTIKEALYKYNQDRQLEKFYTDLEYKIQERTEELKIKNQKLIDLDKEKNEFLGIVVHDLKNPLSAIEGLANLIRMSLESRDINIKEVLNYTKLIETSSHQMFELITNLLDVNAIESGEFNTDVRLVNILPIVEKVINQYKIPAAEKNIELELQNVEYELIAYVDANMLQQVVDNLVSNAVKYSPSYKKVYIRIIQISSYIRCEIQDEGPGLSEEEQQKLFHKFARLSPQPTANENSTGLGLFIAKKLLDMMEGKIWCNSQEGAGSTFIIEVPSLPLT